MRTSKKFSHYEHLKNKWVSRHQKLQNKLWEKHGEALEWASNSSKHAVVGSLAGLMMLTNPGVSANLAQMLPLKVGIENKVVHTSSQLIADLAAKLPSTVQPLTDQQEQEIGQILTDYFKVPTSAILEGKRLNRSYGLIGAEQHLTRYPGDTMATHFDSPDEKIYYSSGMAPGRGAYRYFTDENGQLSEIGKQQEKYYIAVQTFLSPGWHENTKEMYNFFKFRKMLVVNPENGKAIVAVIGDAGPAEWTGKSLGGSPEVMMYLERKDGAAKGPVIYFFIDDPEDKVPLGPITIPN